MHAKYCKPSTEFMLPLTTWEATVLSGEIQGKLLCNQRVEEKKRAENRTEKANLPRTSSYEIAKTNATNRNLRRNIRGKTRT
jgi:hypothetical protein